MTDITTAQIVEAGRDAVTSCRWDHTLAHASNGGPMWTDSDLAQAAYDAMLPLIRKQLADEVRRQCFTSEGAKFAIRQGRSVGEIQEFDAALEFAASLIEGVES